MISSLFLLRPEVMQISPMEYKWHKFDRGYNPTLLYPNKQNNKGFGFSYLLVFPYKISIYEQIQLHPVLGRFSTTFPRYLLYMAQSSPLSFVKNVLPGSLYGPIMYF